MKKLLALILGLTAFNGLAQDDTVLAGLNGMLQYSQSNIQALAEAFTQEQMDWRPAEGVRSAGEAIMHAASANYYFAMKMGFAPPEGVDMMSMESIKDKAAIVDTFKKSSAFILEKAQMVDPASFGEEVDLGFMKQTRIGALMLILEHNAEHKGQLIAYARSNGVVPPWSQAAE